MKLHKLFLLIPVVLILSVKIFGQAAVDIPFIATDGTINMEIAVGLDLTATNCIDTHLGEYSLPPIPPTGGFMIIFDLQPYGCPQKSSFKDYRPPGNPPSFPFSGIIQHTLWYQTSSPGLDVVITYDLPVGTQMSITDQINGTFLNIGPFTGQGVATIPGSYTYIFAKAFVIMEYDNIVPVELTSFTASVLQNEKAVHLNWTTATETNNSGFEIQRTSPFPSPYQGEGGKAGRGWETIGFVPGFGTTTEPKSYSFTDDLSLTPNLTHTLRYRLKQIDFDGSFTYSNEIEVEVDFTPKEFVLYQNFPNPFNPSTTIKYSLPVESQVRINIYNALGEVIEELVSKAQSSGNYEVTWNAQNYSSGIYYYSFEVNSADGSQSHREMKKIVFLK